MRNRPNERGVSATHELPDLAEEQCLEGDAGGNDQYAEPESRDYPVVPGGAAKVLRVHQLPLYNLEEPRCKGVIGY